MDSTKKNQLNPTYVAISVLIVLSLVPIWVIEYQPLQDYPQLLERVNIIKNINNPNYAYGEYFSLNWNLAPNLIGDILVLLFSYFFELTVAGKIVLSIYIILFPLSIFYFLGSIDKKKYLLGFFGFVFLFNWYFNKGFINFLIGASLCFFTFGIWYKTINKRNKKNAFGIGIFAILTYFSHLFSFFILIFLAICASVYYLRNLKKIIYSLMPFFPSLILLTVYLANLFLTSNNVGNIYETFQYIPLGLNIKWLFLSFSSFLLLMLPPIFASILWILLYFNKLREKVTEHSNEIFFAGILFMFFVFFLLLPLHTDLWAYVNMRFVLFIAIISLVLLKVPEKKIGKFLFLLAIFTIFFVVLFDTYFSYLSFSNETNELLAGINHIKQNSKIQPLLFECNVYSEKSCIGQNIDLFPFLHSWRLYPIKKNGYSPYLNIFSEYHLTKYKKGFPAPHPYYPEKFDINKEGNFYDYIIVWGKNEEKEKKIEEKFSLIYKKNKLKLYEKTERIEKK